ncbi:hypothetical protein F5Y09DRAFT_295562 [Xylaria sp. FL1042]|nr:hypothetical protein F5Y09DRAFT_295562 [Xylaria sp. FL1042]
MLVPSLMPLLSDPLGFRFNQAASGLCERNLVQRYQHDELDTLRTHRTLQRSILQRLDNDSGKCDRECLWKLYLQ